MKRFFKTMAFTLLGLVLSSNLMAASATYTKVTASPDDWSGDYILVYETDGAARVFTGVDAISDFVEATISDNTITGEFVTLTLETTDGGYLVKINGGDNDGKYISHSANSNDLSTGTSGAVMTISYDESVFMTNANGAVMRYNKTSGQDRFRFYKSTSYTQQQPVQLYRTPTPTTVDVTGVSLDKTSANVKQGSSLQLTATVAPDDATNKNVSWSVSGNSKVHVSNSGLVTVDNDATKNSTATITATTEDGGFTASCTITVIENKDKELTFSFTSTPTGWPSAKASAAAGEYTYTLNSVDYKFTHTKVGDGIYGSSYLMVNSGNSIGLPILNGYKLVKVVAKNSSGCSTSVNVAVSKSTSSTTATDVVGVSQTWSTTSSTYTYNLTGTTYDTRYYLVVSSKNCQLTELTLSYEKKPDVTSISVAQAPTKTAYKVGDVFNPAGLQISVNYGGVIPAETITYNDDTKDGFTFEPSLSTELTTSKSSVTIGYGGKTTPQAITVTRYATEITAEDNKEVKVGDKITLTDWYTITSDYDGTMTYTSGDDETFLVKDDLAEAEQEGSTTLTITASQTAKYEGTSKVINVSVISASAPQLSVDETELTWENIPVGESGEGKVLTISSDNLAGDINLAIEGTNAGQFSVTPTSIAQADEIGEVTVTYSPTAAGNHVATLKISSTNATTLEVALTGNALAKYTAKWSINGVIDDSKNEIVIDGNKVTSVPTATSCDPDNIAFLGWTNTTIADAAEAPEILFTDVASAPAVTDNITYYAVFAEIGGSGEMVDKLITSAEYDTWTFSGTTTNITPASDPSYRLFGQNAYVETAEIDLSKITKISIYGGCYGGDSYGVTKIVGVVGATTTTWKDPAALGGKSQTARHDFEVTSNPLSGTGKIRVISKSGTGLNNGTGTRMTKVEVYTQEEDITYSHYSTTCVPPLVAPTLTEGGEFCTNVNVTISKGENPEGVTLMYSTDNGASWNTYSTTLNITTTTTIKAKAVLSPKESEPAEASYTILPHYSDLTALKAVATENVQKACVSFSNLLVNATNVNTVYLTDGTNTYLIFKMSHGFSRGQKLSTGEHTILPYDLFNGVLRFKDNTGITAAEGTFETPATTMAVDAITAADFGKLVKIENVIYNETDGVFTDASSNTIKLGSNIAATSSWVTNGAKYDITGIITTQTVDEITSILISPRVKESDVVSKAEKLNAPSNLTYENLTGSSVTLKWDEVTGAAKYDVEVYDGATCVKNYQTTSLSYGPTGLTSGKTYTWRVRSVGDDLTTSTSEWTDGTATFTTPAPATLYWIVNGDMEHPFATTTAASEKVVMPTTDPTSACDENYEDFICWVNRPVVGVQTRAPFNYELVADTSKAKSADGDKYFYALFGKVASEGSEAYVKVVADQDDWTGDYLIGKETSGTIFDGSRPRTGEALDDTYNTQSITIPEDGTITNVDDVKAYQFSIAKSSTTKDDDADAVYYTIKSAQNYYIGGKNDDNGMNSNSSFSTKTYDNIITWLTENNRVQISSYYGNTYLTFNNIANQQRFRYMKNEDKTITLYKRVTTPTTYSAYITTCPTFYDITIADGIVGGSVDADPKNTIDAGTTIQLTADASDGYTAEGGTWTVKDATENPITVKNNQFTMPASNVTVSYAFVALVDNFQDALHGAEAQTGVGAQYDLPSLANTTEGTRKDAFFKFAGWVPATTEITTGEPATTKPEILEGKQDATGATYKALWANTDETAFITEECETAIPTNLHVVNDALTANSAKLDWNNVTGATKYHVSVYQATDLVVETDVESSEYVATSLTAATEYTFTVKAFKGCWGYEADAVPFKTKDAAVPHLVTLVAENGQIEISPELTDGKLLEGTVATVTATADEGYYFVSWNFSNVTPTSVNENVATFAMPTKAITITATFAEFPKVTWKMEGQADVVTSAVPSDDKFEVGTVKAAPNDWKYKAYFPEFAGWVTADKCDAEGNVTNAEFVTTATEVPAAGLTVYGAVAKSASADLTQTTKVVADANIETDAIYVIGAAQSSTVETMYYLYSVDGEKNWGRMATADDETNSPMLLTAEVVTGGFALKNAAGLYIQGTTAKSKFPAMKETAATLTLSTTAADESAIHHIYSTSTFYMRHNYSGTTQGIRWYDATNTGTPAYLYKVGLAYENLTINPQPDYGRTDLVVGNYGTVCVPYTVKVADRSGATFWSIETSNMPGYTNPTSVTIVQETEDLEAGKPYIFCAEGTTMSLFFSGDKYEGTTSVAANGLYGNLTDETIIINPTVYEPGYFFVLQQKLYECGVNCTVRPNRGWIQANQINVVPAPLTAPRRVIGNPNVAPTRIDNLSDEGWVEMTGAHKYFRNGTIIIVNEGKLYNAQGQIVK